MFYGNRFINSYKIIFVIDFFNSNDNKGMTRYNFSLMNTARVLIHLIMKNRCKKEFDRNIRNYCF